jgi:DNA-binding PadR family transcriptional regulator
MTGSNISLTKLSAGVILAAMRAAANLQEPTFLILAALAGGDLHGYGIIKEVETLSDTRLHLSPGTLYGALDRLKNDGLVEVTGEERVEGRLRRYYHLTDSGASALQQEIDRQERVTHMAREKLQKRAAQPRPVQPQPVRPAEVS